MKKLLALVLILAMASAASAGTITVTADGTTTGLLEVDPFTVVTIDLIISGYGVTPPMDSFATLSIGSITGEGMASDPALHAELTNLPLTGTIVNDGVTLIANIGGGVPMGDMDGIPDGSSAYSFTLNVGDIGTYVIDLMGVEVLGTFGPPALPTEVAALTVNVVPEPMTIALLGLGGLFLRRRRS